jgi:septation ring formation regulator EzrA
VDPDVFITIAFGLWVVLLGLVGALVFIRERRAPRVDSTAERKGHD